MNFVYRLQQTISTTNHQQHNEETNETLNQWNQDIEELLFSTPEERVKRQQQVQLGETKLPDDADDTKEEELVEKSTVDSLVLKLRCGIITRLAQLLGISGDNQEKDELSKLIVERIQETAAATNTNDNGSNDINATNITIDTTSSPNTEAWMELESLVRTSSNFLRWYLQIYLAKFPLVYPMSSSPFQTTRMLTVIVFLIEYNAKLPSTATNNRHQSSTESDAASPALSSLSPPQRFARYASLLLFYATFSPQSPNDQLMQQTHERLVNGLNFFPRVLQILTYEPQTTAALALSLIRNVHNLLASFPGAVQVVQSTGFPYNMIPNNNEASAEIHQLPPPAPQAPWNPKPDDNTNGLITFPSIFRDILIWCLTTPTLPPFPGPPHDRRADLVVEILGIIFAIGGTEVARALRYPCPNPALSNLVIAVLQMNDDNATAAATTTTTNATTSDPRIYQVKLSTITILTDASPTFGTYLVEQEGALDALMTIAQRQVDSVLETTQVDTIAVSALVPSLAVLYKLSAGNPTFRQATKNYIFPPSQEDYFWQLAQEQLLSDSSGGGTSNNSNSTRSRGVPSAKNMHPLDAPRSTFRWKLIRLMTWTESHIKRYASELLWALCDEDPKEFVLRTGLGNAMAFLAAKGLVQLPSSASSSSTTTPL